MKRKRVLAFLVSVLYVLSLALPVSAAAANTVTASVSATATQGDTQYCYVYIDSLENLAALTVSVHFDPEKVRVTNAYNSVTCTMYDSAVAEESVQFSYLFDGNGQATETQLFWFAYKILNDAPVGETYFDILVSDAYDSGLNAVAVSGSRSVFQIQEKVVSKSCFVYTAGSLDTAVLETFALTYQLSTYEVAAGSVVIQYDPELFQVAEVSAGALLENKYVDINTSLSGAVYISFVGTEYAQYQYELLTVKFRTLKNVTETSQIQFTASELYDLDTDEVACSGCSTSVAVSYDASYTADAPAITALPSYDAATGQVTVEIRLDKDSHLGAGDFTLEFDPALLTYASAVKGFSPNYFLINDKKVAEGSLKFSVISMSDITEETLLLTATFDAKASCEAVETSFQLSGSGLADSLTNSIVLNVAGAGFVIPAAPHIYEAAVTEPTCTEQGYTTHTCTRCGDSYVDTYVDATGHSFGEWVEVEPATCTEKGSEKQTCATCGHEAYRDIPALGHNHVATVTPPTCTERGHTTHICSRCQDTYVDTYVDATGHSYGDWTEVKPASCTEKGSEKQTCATCGHEVYRDIPTSGHNHVAKVTPPTCTERGYTTHTCHCGDSYVDTYVKATGHSYSTVVTPPTASEQGYTTYTCRHCGHSYRDNYTDPTGPTKITSDYYTVTDTHLSKVVENTTVKTLISHLAAGGIYTVTKDGKTMDADALVGTGMQVNLVRNGQVLHSVTVVVTGDVSGDGKITITDMLAVKAHVLKKTLLTGVYLTAGDTSGDGSVTITDFIQIKAYILGKGPITPR